MTGKCILITGGAGFIGSHVVRTFVNKYPAYQLVNLDALTYAGNPANLDDVAEKPNYHFVKGDIRDKELLDGLFREWAFDGLIHLAAETHVDRSITGPSAFVQTNVQGTLNLLKAALKQWEGQFKGKRFYQISTDEVYGSLGDEGFFSETSPYAPNSPYAASKAAADHMVRAYGTTFGLPYVISNCSNNFGPNQYPEKLIPLCIRNLQSEKPIPVYGKGNNVRDWIYVEDHATAVDLVFHKGKPAETYCIGGGNELRNIDLIRDLCRIMDRKLGREEGKSAAQIAYVQDRPGHDHRYAVDSSKIRSLGWQPVFPFQEALNKTVDWYLQNPEWMEKATGKEYDRYYRNMYGTGLEPQKEDQ